MRFDQVSIVTNGDMSASINSNGIDVNQQVVGSIHAVFSGAPVGSLTLEVSNDIVPVGVAGNQSSNVVNWTTYTGSATAVAAAGSVMYNLVDMGFHWVRLVYTRTGGTGTLNVVYCGKGV